MILNRKRKKLLMYIAISYFIVNSFVWLITIVVLDQNKALEKFEQYDLFFKLSYIIPIFIIFGFLFSQKMYMIDLHNKYERYMLAKKYNDAYELIKAVYLKTMGNNILLLYAISCCNINKFEEFRLLYKEKTGSNSILDCYKLFADYINEKLISKLGKFKDKDNLILLLKWIAYYHSNDKNDTKLDIKILKKTKFINPLYNNVVNKIIKEIENIGV